MGRLTFLGIGAGSPDEILRGKRRTAMYMAFLCFTFIIAAMDADDWVTGGLVFDIGGPLGVDIETLPTEVRQVCNMAGTDLESIAAAAEERALELGTPMLGVTITPKFHLGLTRYTQGGQTYMRWSNAAVERDCYYALADELNDINAATKLNNTWWYGQKPFDIGIFNATFGLLGFSVFLQSCLYFLLLCVAYDAPHIATHRFTTKGVRFLSIGVCFFTFVAVLYFGTSKVKESFCNAFDPDTRFNGTFCGYQTGFDLAITALIFTIVQSLALWFWLPADLAGAAKYEFASKAGYDSVGAPSEASGGGNSASAPIASSSYQDSYQVVE